MVPSLLAAEMVQLRLHCRLHGKDPSCVMGLWHRAVKPQPQAAAPSWMGTSISIRQLQVPSGALCSGLWLRPYCYSTLLCPYSHSPSWLSIIREQ
jgi:hypothetical protein